MTNLNPRAYPDRPYVGVGVVVFRDEEVLLAKRNKEPRKDRWSIPGGAQELGETVEEAAYREIYEETGLEVKLLGLVKVVNSINRDANDRVMFHYTLVDFFAEYIGGEAVAADDISDVKWVSLSDLKSYNLRKITYDVIKLSAVKREQSHTVL
ncbi:MAG: NUDIX hydrolase [Pseudomonadota bacterium]|nr:NUDIX hydrolase [Pseudomonadota bacterium]